MIAIDFVYLAQLLLPSFLRKRTTINMLTVFISPLAAIKTSFYNFYTAKKYELSFSGQVIYLEHLLNDQFDYTLRRIKIDEEEQYAEYYLYNQDEENEETYLYNNAEDEDIAYFYSQSEYDSDNDFTIHMPEDVIYDELFLRALVNQYKTASKRFNIKLI